MPKGQGKWDKSRASKARKLRSETSESEVVLWKFLRGDQQGVRFRRQVPVGPYVLDFYAPRIRLAIEVDGPTHQEAKDAARDQYLRDKGIEVFRISSLGVRQEFERSNLLELVSIRIQEFGQDRDD